MPGLRSVAGLTIAWVRQRRGGMPQTFLRALQQAAPATPYAHEEAKSTRTQRMHEENNNINFESTYSYHEEVQVTIDSLTEEGLGQGIDGDRIILVPGTIPGETVKAKIYKQKGENYHADLTDLLISSPQRVEPRCPYFGRCGGCQLMHMDKHSQRQYKSRQVVEAFQNIGKFEWIDSLLKPIIVTDDMYGYRTKLNPRYFLHEDGSRDIGFEHIGRSKILDIVECAIATPIVNAAFKNIRGKDIIRKRKKFNRGSLIIRESADGSVATDYKTVIKQDVGALTFRFMSGFFFQINKYVVPLMVDYVISQALGHGCTQLIDTYCGAGLFALCAAGQFEKLVAVEIDKPSIQWAIKNGIENNISKVSFLSADSANIFANINPDDGPNSVVIVDPPRVGCSDDFLSNMIKFRPKKIVYVSCNPKTQAKDARTIVDNGYAMIEITPIDLFPQTKHIESVVTFLGTNKNE